MANLAKIVSLIDISNSMNFYDYITSAKSALDTFLNMFQPNDRFAVIAFETNIHRTYPNTANLAVYDSPQVMADASAAVQALKAYGNTNMGDAIIAGKDLLAPEQEPRGMVLLSDGYANTGPKPLDVIDPNLRTYTIALGPNSDTSLLREISNRTQGQYFYSPDEIGLASIYFDILEYGQVGQVVNNAYKQVTETNPLRVPVKLSSGLDHASIGVNWANPNITYDETGNPQDGQVTVRVLDPDFKVVQPPIVDRDYGFVVFQLPQPKGGTWQFDCFYKGNGNANMTVGALDPDLVADLDLAVDETVVEAGGVAEIRLRPTVEERPLDALRVSGQVEAPAVSLVDALERYGDRLPEIDLDDDRSAEREDVARLVALRRQLLPHVDILPRITLPAEVAHGEDGECRIRVHTHLPGEYLVRVGAEGQDPRHGVVQRTRLVNITAV